MSDRLDDVRATSDALLAHTERIHDLEIEKRSLDPHGPRYQELSLQIEDLGTRIATMTSIEREVAEPLEGSEHR